MGFSVYYRTTEPVEPATRAAIDATCAKLCRGRTWLSCEPVWFFGADDDGHMMGGSKPNFMPHPDDVASAMSEGLPDGTVQDALDVLCQLSRDHRVDWEISHDDSGGPIGFIRSGQADPEVLVRIEAFASLGDILAEFGEDEPFEGPPDDDDDGPRILPFGPKDD